MSRPVQKLAVILVISTLITATSIEVFFLTVSVTENPAETSATNEPIMASETLTPGINSYIPLENTKTPLPLEHILYICYPVQFKKD